MRESSNEVDITEMIYRLKTRLALANFKRQYGYEKYDLHTLESNLFIKKHLKLHQKEKRKVIKHRYYPVVLNHSNSIHSSNFQKSNNTLFHPSLYPLSEKRSTFPKNFHNSIIQTDEDAAHLLVMLHNMSSKSLCT